MNLLRQLAAEGVSLWLTDATRARVLSGELAELVDHHHVRGAVHELGLLTDSLHEPCYHRQLLDLAALRVTPEAGARLLLAQDLRLLCDEFAELHAVTDGRDGLVSATVATVPASSAAAEVRALHWAVNRPNLLVRVPVGAPWLPLVSDLLADGIGVDAGSVHSPAVFQAAAEACLDGLERATLNGRDLSRIATVVTVPLGDLDAALESAGDGSVPAVSEFLRHRICTAVARLVQREHDQLLDGDRWRALAAAGARPPRLVFSATEAVGPAGPDTRHVDGFVGWGVVSAVSSRTLAAVADHALLEGDTLTGRHISAGLDLAELERHGVSFHELASGLQTDQLEQLVTDWSKLLQRVTDELERRR